MMKYRFFLLACLLAGGLRFSSAETTPLEKRVVEHTCPNGIKLLILERHFSPTVAIRMMFRTGSVDEVSGKTGLAHMFEHMMFKGTRTLGTKNYEAEKPLLAQIDSLHRQLEAEKGKGDRANQTRIAHWIDALRSAEKKEAGYVLENELWNLYEREGASNLNAMTTPDFTQYFMDLPSNKIALWALLDSDRLKNPVFRQFYQELEVVKEERRMRVDTNPEGKLYENLLATAFVAHSYRHPTIGWDSDLDGLNVDDMEAFYRQHYTPDRLTIALVGDVKADEMISLVDRSFGTWKQTPPANAFRITQEPHQTGFRMAAVRADAQPELVMGYHISTYPHPDHVVWYALSYLLGNGNTSRLYKTLVEKKGLAASIESGQEYPGARYDSLLIIEATTRHPHTTQEVQQAIRSELDRLKQTPIESWELEKVRAAVDMELLNTLQTNGGMATSLAQSQTVYGDWRYLMRFQEAIQRLSAQDIQRVARQTFMPENETLAVLEPSKP